MSAEQSSDSHAYDAREEEALHRMEQSEVFSTSIGINTDKSSVKGEPVGEDTPYCTLKWFPATMDHCIEWARDKFNSTFYSKPTLFNDFWRTYTVEEAINQLKNGSVLEDAAVVRKMTTHLPVSVECCITAARLKFEKFFNHSAKQLLLDFPLDKKMPDGSPFWQSPKRPPHPIDFDSSSKHHMEFVTTFSQLHADLHCIPYSSEDFDDEMFELALEKISIPVFVPKSKSFAKYFLAKKPEGEPISSQELEASASRLEEWIYKGASAPSQLNPHLEEKENDTDECVDFIIAASHLRAEMYGIRTEAGAQKTTDDVAPAASAGGLVDLELTNVAMASSSSQFKSLPSVSPTAANEKDNDYATDLAEHDGRNSCSTGKSNYEDPNRCKTEISTGNAIPPSYGLNVMQRNDNMIKNVVQSILPATISNLRAIETRAEETDKLRIKVPSKTQHSVSVDTTVAGQTLFQNLETLYKATLRMYGDANDISSGGFPSTPWEFHVIRKTMQELKLDWERLSRTNKMVNQNNYPNYERNQIKILDQVELIFNDKMLKEFLPEGKIPLRSECTFETVELVYMVLKEIRTISELIVRLRMWIKDADMSNDATLKNEIPRHNPLLGLLDEVDILCARTLQESQNYETTREKVVLDCVIRQESVERNAPLKNYDFLMRLVWLKKVPDLVKACQEVLEFLQDRTAADP